jgi:hypothetical protein
MWSTKLTVLVALLAIAAAARVDASESTLLADGEFQTHRYEVRSAPDGLDWQAAAEAAGAEGRNGYLATVNDRAESDFLIRLTRDPAIARECDDRIFLGGSDAEEEGVWAWVDQRPWEFENWRPGQPDGGESENYLAMCHGLGTGDRPMGRRRSGESSPGDPPALPSSCVSAGSWHDVSGETDLRCFVVEYPHVDRGGPPQAPEDCATGRLEGEWLYTVTLSQPDTPELGGRVGARVKGVLDLEVDSYGGADGAFHGEGEVLEASWVEKVHGVTEWGEIFGIDCDFGDTLTKRFDYGGFSFNSTPDGVDLRFDGSDTPGALRFKPHRREECDQQVYTDTGQPSVEPVVSDLLFGLAPFLTPYPDTLIHVPLDENGNGSVRLQHDGPAAVGACLDYEASLEASGIKEIMGSLGPLPDLPFECHIETDFTIEIRGLDPKRPCKPDSPKWE